MHRFRRWRGGSSCWASRRRSRPTWRTAWATLIGAAVAAWPAVVLVGSYELLMMVIRSSQAAPRSAPGSTGVPDPLQEEAAEVFADQLAADRVPSVRAIRAQLHVGQPRAQRLRDYLAAGAAGRSENAAA